MSGTGSVTRQARGALRLAWVGLATLAVAACTPAFNWRKVPIADVHVMLPCKPDAAERVVPLAGSQITMRMVGCEVEGALYAVSYVELASPAHAAPTQKDWQRHTLEALGAQNVTLHAWRPPLWAASPVSVRASGTSQAGKPLEAQLHWLVRDARLYHLAVYAPTLTESMTDPMTLEP